MIGTFNMRWGDWKCLQNLGQRTWRNDTPWKIERMLKDRSLDKYIYVCIYLIAYLFTSFKSEWGIIRALTDTVTNVHIL
jgi:hypothetical protein